MSADSSKNKSESTGLLRRMFKRVSNPREDVQEYIHGDLSSEKKTQMLIHKQRNDMERKREFEELRKIYASQVTKDDSDEFQVSGGDMSKANAKHANTLSKINQLESQMASRWSNKTEKDTSNGSRMNGVTLPQSTQAIKTSDLSELSDPFLEEIAVLFASNEDEQVERSLQELLGEESPQRDDRGTWLTLLDFYRAVGKQAAFETAAMEYMAIFSESAPQWRVFDRSTLNKMQGGGFGSSAYWVAPAVIDGQSAQDMNLTLVNVTKPVRVMDWSAVRDIMPDGANGILSVLAKLDQPDILLQVASLPVLLNILITKIKDVQVEDREPFWRLRLELLRLFESVDDFDLAAMEFCLAYEVSPPSWIEPKCKTENMDTQDAAEGDTLSGKGAVTSLVASSNFFDQGMNVMFALKGAYKGSMSKTLKGFDSNLVGVGGFLTINCDCLMRVDFSAAGDLLNWISEKTAKGYTVHFINVHRLVALFFIVMGITVAAQVTIRKD